MIYGLRSGLIDELSNTFPDPRKEEEISTKLILSASIAGHFADMYALSQSPYALHSPTLLAELGLNVKVLSKGEGISRRGTKQNAPFNGDVIRKMLSKIRPDELIHWYNKNVGKAYLRKSGYRPSFHILDCTDLEVNIDNDVNVKLKIHNYSAEPRANVAEKNTHSQPFFNDVNRVLFPPSSIH
jgi:hypothetical protein